jgi:phosphatidylglycerol lysyltransferase
VESSTTAGREPPSSPWRWVKPAVTVVIFAALAWGLRQLLTSFSYDEVIAGLDAMAPARIAAAAAVVAVVHALYIVRERLAVDFAGASSLAWRKVAIASLIARSLSTLGIATITGLALRVRIYQDYRLDGAAVARITIYNESTYYVGLVAAFAVVLTATALPTPVAAGFTLPWLGWVGPAALVAVVAYLTWNLRRRGPLTIRRFELPVFTPVQLGAQVVLPVVDTFLAGLITLALVPTSAGLDYLTLVAIGLVANVMGSLSQVPGGLGVYETVVLGFVPPAAHPATLAALLVRRAVVNLLPIAVGTVLLVGFALEGQLRKRPNRVALDLGRDALAIATFAGSVLSLLAAAVPRANGLTEQFGGVGQGAVFLAGLVTLVAARGLQQGRRKAWWVAVVMFGLRGVAAVAAWHGPSVAVAVGLFAILVVARPLCPHPGPLFDGERMWWAAWLVALIATAWFADTHPDALSTEVRARTAAMIVVVALVIGALARRALPGRRRRRKR